MKHRNTMFVGWSLWLCCALGAVGQCAADDLDGILAVEVASKPDRPTKDDQSDAPQQWAVIVAVQTHDDQRLNTLHATLRDASEVRRILVERGGVPSDHVLEMTDLSAPDMRSRLAELRTQLAAFLAAKSIRRHDRVLVFFSGHGVLWEGQTYLVPADADADRIAQTCWPLDELRAALQNCVAETKLVVMDCCHAGGLGETKLTAPASVDLQKSVAPDSVPGCVLLASCKKDEVSHEWPDRKHGIFTFWLSRALEGGADLNRDGQLTVGEIYNFTFDRVPLTAQVLGAGKQTPVRFINTDIEGDPVLVSLKPELPESLCRRLAEQLDLEIRRHGLKHIGVLEFVTVVGNRDALAPATLPQFLSDRVRVNLATLSDGQHSVLEHKSVRQALGEKNIVLADLGKPQTMRRLGESLSQLDGLVWGRIDRRGSQISVQCELLDMNSKTLATPTGLLPLSEELQGDLGASFDNRQRPAGSPHAVIVVEHVDTQSQTHPLLKPDFPFRVEVWSIHPRPDEPITDKTERRRKEHVLRPRPDEPSPELLIAAAPDELFEIRVENRSGQDVALTLLLDGLNSLGQQRERLGRASSWIVRRPVNRELLDGLREKQRTSKLSEIETQTLADETVRAQRPPQYVFDAWVLDQKSGELNQVRDVTTRRFRFTDIAESVAARARFTDSIGLITAAFYAERGRALGVGEGPEEVRDLKTVDFKPGRLLGVVQIRYVEQQELTRLLKRD